jgi:hypothetical protein
MDNDLLEGFQVGAAAAGRRRERELQKANQDRLAQQEQARIAIQREAQDRANKLADIKLQDEEEGRKYQQNVAADVAKAQAAKALEQRGFDATPEMIRKPGARPEFDEEAALDAAQRRHLAELPLHEQVAMRQALTNERYRKDYVNALGDRNAASADARERGLGLREQALALAQQRAESSIAGRDPFAPPHKVVDPDTGNVIGLQFGAHGEHFQRSGGGDFTPVMGPNGHPLPGVYRDNNNRVVKVNPYTEMLGGFDAPGAEFLNGGGASKTNTPPVTGGKTPAAPKITGKSGKYSYELAPPEQPIQQ